MIWLAYAVIAQTAAQPAPHVTGNPAIDTVFYMLSSLLGLLGLREGTYWLTRIKGRKNGDGDGLSKLAATNERMAESMERIAERLDHIDTICTKLEDRSR
jgi:hypothetical protein